MKKNEKIKKKHKCLTNLLYDKRIFYNALRSVVLSAIAIVALDVWDAWYKTQIPTKDNNNNTYLVGLTKARQTKTNETKKM